ncbi:MAG: HU family DNA-binding protein [Planctomycetota bacterium]
MTKTELIDAVASDLGISKTESQKIVETIFGRMTTALSTEGKMQIQGFGTFQKKLRKERMGRNPQTKQPMLIPASKTVTFKPGQDLKSKL